VDDGSSKAVLTKPSSAVEPFDTAFLAQLGKLDILARKMFRGKLRGEKRSRKLGQSVEFHDFRQYLPGDDIRRIDWNLYARLERYFIKLFVEEEDLTLYLIVDCSKSMDFGAPNKFVYALRLAAALSYVALANLERVQVAIFDDSLSVIQRPTRGRSRFKRLMDVLGAQSPGGATSLTRAIARFVALDPLPGVIVVVSDFLFENPTQALSGLVGRGNQVVLAQTLAPSEIKPELAGDLELVDAESGRTIEVSMGAGVFKRYIRNLGALRDELSRWAVRTQSDYILIPTDTDISTAVLGRMRNIVVR
jgi:uncharacterized protein (DUF58 family)